MPSSRRPMYSLRCRFNAHPFDWLILLVLQSHISSSSSRHSFKSFFTVPILGQLRHTPE
ncbi:hypothetical protein JAAARDRAFT_469828 [Jaapia argillacea MUCL 33604]|uniref:Uncharacterized protein n=1 Tax=Jaapia argillacea MUCL 33604 TaxID=933084 RepID=A0A067QGU0_9AGAM|nr:hypothetical protein JAAARDRAFT_469828 [Jaapia argillacea MUCL 33604]